MEYPGRVSETYQSTGSSEFLRHEPCDNCGSSDGLAVYTDHNYCFVCHTHETTNGQQTIVHNHQQRMSYIGSAERLHKRNISEKTCERFKIYRDGDKLRFYYHNSDGVPIGAKTRTANKIFSYEGESNGSFFGQHLWKGHGKQIIITEGEIDAATYAEILPNWDVVSLPNGAAGAKKAVQKNYEFLQGYDSIVLWFDNDEPGKEAAKAAASVLPPGKVFIARLEAYKDISDAWQANVKSSIDKAFWSKKAYRPDGIVEGKNLLELVTTPNPPFGS